MQSPYTTSPLTAIPNSGFCVACCAACLCGNRFFLWQAVMLWAAFVSVSGRSIFSLFVSFYTHDALRFWVQRFPLTDGWHATESICCVCSVEACVQ